MNPRRLIATSLSFAIVLALGTKMAEASNLNCNVRHLSATIEGDTLEEIDTTGSLSLTDYDAKGSPHLLRVNAVRADGDQNPDTLNLSLVPPSAGETHSYAAIVNRSLEGHSLPVTYSLKILRNKSFTLIESAPQSPQTPTQKYTGTCDFY